MRRREFITLLGGATALPLTVRAQQLAVPVVGLLRPGSPEQGQHLREAFRQGCGKWVKSSSKMS